MRGQESSPYQALYASTDGHLYRVALGTVSEIADLIGETQLETLASGDALIDFWFTPTSERCMNPNPTARPVNRQATELLLATTRFTASNVPLQRGAIVLASHDSAGRLRGLTNSQMSYLIGCAPSWQEDRILKRRIEHDVRSRRRLPLR